VQFSVFLAGFFSLARGRANVSNYPGAEASL
jgi:hypothetical protein